MSRLSRSVLLAFAAAVVAGACLHFLYDLLPCTVTALLAPVSESLWEHGKLLYWPSLVTGLVLRNRPGARAFSLLLGTAVMMAVGWLYHIPLGGESLLFDIVLYILAMGICLLLRLWAPRSWSLPSCRRPASCSPTCPASTPGALTPIERSSPAVFPAGLLLAQKGRRWFASAALARLFCVVTSGARCGTPPGSAARPPARRTAR